LPFQIKLGQKIFPTHPARRSRDLPTNDKNRASLRKRFSSPDNFAKKNDQPPRRLRSKVDAHYSTSHLDSVIARSFADLAVQRRLGLLSKRRARIDSIDRDNSRLDEASLI
jgi:hypothetical protein